MIVKLAACLVAAAALFGPPCVASEDSGDTPKCATKPEQLDGIDLAMLFIKHHGKIDLEPSDGCLVVGEPPKGLAAVRLALPAFEGPYAVKVSAPVGKSIILPRVIFLDEQYRTTRTFGPDDLKRRGTEMSLEIFIEPANSDEKYVLIYADPAHIGDQDRRTVSRTDTLYVGTGYILLGSEVGSDVTAEDTGDIVVSLIGERFEQMRRRK
jgi:Maltose operon periplasmic protein precursor (MalM)